MTNDIIPLMRAFLKRLLRKAGYELHPRGTLPVNTRQMRNLIRLECLFGRIRSIEGAVVECGVGKGRTFLFLAFLIEREKKGRMLY